MIELYSSSSPNVQKITLMLEELELPYRLIPINTHKGDQFAPEFVRLNPNSKVPVIIDLNGPGGQPYRVFESGAILIYLAEKQNSTLLPSEGTARYDVIQWLIIQLTGVGPMFGQFNHFRRFADQDTYATRRYTSESRRLYDLIELRLVGSPFLGGKMYSIADIATFPWIRTQSRLFGEKHPVMRFDWDGHPNITRWFREIEARPAVQRALTIIDQQKSTLSTASPKELDLYFGRGEFARKLE